MIPTPYTDAERDAYEHRGQHPDECAICHPADELTPTWGEVIDGWDPDADGQGNEGLAAALDRIEEERTTSRATFGRDFTGTPRTRACCCGRSARTASPCSR